MDNEVTEIFVIIRSTHARPALVKGSLHHRIEVLGRYLLQRSAVGNGHVPPKMD